MRIIYSSAAPPWIWALALALPCFLGPAVAAEAPRVHRNVEYGIEARFPVGSRVCEARSGDHPIGFYAWLGRQTDCGVAMPRSMGAMNITANYNAAFETSPSVLLECRNDSVPRGSRVDLRGLALPGIRSTKCAVRRGDGSLEIFVAAQGGNWGGRVRSSEARAPLINYYAVLRTRPERAQRDMATFRRFLSQIVIRHIVSE
jgi:hypothetical protein